MAESVRESVLHLRKPQMGEPAAQNAATKMSASQT
jgi:hypothetical protein